MLMKDTTMDDAVAKAKHYLALGQTEVYLSNGPFPWDIASRCEPGGSHRMGIATNVWFFGHHKCGLTFRWSFDIEPQSANGDSKYHIDVAGCRTVLSRLTGPCASAFRKYLANCARTVRDHANELSDYAAKEYGAANELERASV